MMQEMNKKDDMQNFVQDKTILLGWYIMISS